MFLSVEKQKKKMLVHRWSSEGRLRFLPKLKSIIVSDHYHWLEITLAMIDLLKL